MIENFERLLRQGAVFDVPDSGDWILYDQEDNELCRGATLETMINSAPGSLFMIFDDLEVEDRFTYLDQDWTKITMSKGRRDDGIEWAFRGNTEILKK